MIDITHIIKEKLEDSGGCAEIGLLKGNNTFHVQLSKDGVFVNNLDKFPFLEWKVFEKVIELLNSEDEPVIKGDAMTDKLGGARLPINSVEGYIAKEVYGRKIGDSVFRRITPIVNILIWVGICKNGNGTLSLK